MRRTSSRLLAALLAVFALVGLAAAPASAHGDVGVIEVDAPQQTGDLAVSLNIRLTYENDAEPVAEDEVSEISVAGVGPDGATIGPETGFVATDVPGVYSVDLTFPAPGSWDLTITSVEPDATATTTVQVEGVTSTTEADATTDTVDESADDATDDTVAEGTAVIVERSSGEGEQTPLLVTLLLAAVVAAGAVGVVLFWRRRNRVAEPASTASGEEGGSAAT